MHFLAKLETVDVAQIRTIVEEVVAEQSDRIIERMNFVFYFLVIALVVLIVRLWLNQ